jgi:hypothetical protein
MTIEDAADFLDDIAECLTGKRKLEAGSMDLATGKRYRTLAKEYAKALRKESQPTTEGPRLIVYLDRSKKDGMPFCVDGGPDGESARFTGPNHAARFVENELYRMAGRKPE